MTVSAIIPTSIDVSPSLSMNDAGDRWLANSVEISNSLVGHCGRHLANASDISLSEFGLGQLFAFRYSALCDHVVGVVSVRAEEQVVGSNTLAVVASMENQGVVDWAVVQFPRVPVGHDLSGRSIEATTNADASVSVSVVVTRPFPALVGPVNMGPESRNIVSAVERHQGSLR